MSTQARLASAAIVAGGVLAMASACGIVTGVDKYEVVDCPSGSCSDASSSSETTTDAATGVDASTDSAPDVIRLTCSNGKVQVTIEVDLKVGTHVLNTSEGLDIAPGETKAFCARSDGGGGGVRLETSTGSAVNWDGGGCSRSDRCEFLPTSPLTIHVSP